jgi:adenosyl cobinamide kinase/adenosyl cobinamide phosphate guanylyltransferase
MEITLITGGQRSGKSSFAQKLAEEKSANPILKTVLNDINLTEAITGRPLKKTSISADTTLVTKRY